MLKDAVARAEFMVCAPKPIKLFRSLQGVYPKGPTDPKNKGLGVG